MSAVSTCGHSCHSHPRLRRTHACKGVGEEEGTQTCRQAGEKLEVQPPDKGKHVSAEDAHGEAVEGAQDTALMGLPLIFTPQETDPARTERRDNCDERNGSSSRSLRHAVQCRNPFVQCHGGN